MWEGALRFPGDAHGDMAGITEKLCSRGGDRGPLAWHWGQRPHPILLLPVVLLPVWVLLLNTVGVECAGKDVFIASLCLLEREKGLMGAVWWGKEGSGSASGLHMLTPQCLPSSMVSKPSWEAECCSYRFKHQAVKS